MTTKSIKSYSHKRSKRLFKSSFIERLTRTHILLPVSIFLIIATTVVSYGINKGFINGIEATLFFLLGFFVFTWVEYNVHRYVFHMAPSNSSKENIQYKIHGVHHEYPKDKERLAMPPLVSITITVILFFLFKLLIGNYTFGFLPGFITGYTAYIMIHYSIHAFKPPKNFLRILWIHHSIHHHKHHDKAYGVSSPIWDFIYRTMPPK